MDRKRRSFNHFHADIRDSTSLIDNRVGFIREDRNGNLWIGTRDGLNKVLRLDPSNPNRVMFQRYSYTSEAAGNRLIENILHDLRMQGAFQSSRGEFWTLADDGISVYDAEQAKLWQASGKNDRLTADFLNFYEDASGTIWIITRAGLYEVDNTSKRIHRFLDVELIESVAEDRFGNLSELGQVCFQYYEWKRMGIDMDRWNSRTAQTQSSSLCDPSDPTNGQEQKCDNKVQLVK